MSNKYKDSKDIPHDVLINRLTELAEAVADRRIHEFSMRIPAELDRDADLVLSECAGRMDRFEKENKGLREIIDGILNESEYMPDAIMVLKSVINEKLKELGK